MNSIDEYLSLFSPSVRQKPRFKALARMVLDQVMEMTQLVRTDFPEAYLPETAVGEQLDALGVLMNVPRPKPFMPDETYRFLLRARMAAHSWDGTNDTLSAVLEAAFPGKNAKMIDRLDGTVSCMLDGNLPDGLSARDVFPVPAGVRVREE